MYMYQCIMRPGSQREKNFFFFFLTHKVNIRVMDRNNSNIMFQFYGVVFTCSHFWLQQFSGKKTPLSAIYEAHKTTILQSRPKRGTYLCYFAAYNKKIK